MKISTAAAALLLSSEAYAAQEVGRMRKVKIYSSSTVLRNVELDSRDVYDPYIGLPDEREQKRGLEEQLSMSRAGSMPTNLEMSMPATRLTDQSFSLEMSIPALIPLEMSMSMPATSLTGQSFSLEMSMPTTSLTDQSFSLEMSMPATGLTDQSFSHPPVQGGAIGSISTTILETPMPVRSRRLTDQSEVSRMRKVKIYSSSSTILRNGELDSRDVYDPYIGLPDEREQKRGLEEQLSMPRAGSMPTNLEMSMPATRLTDQSFSLEMSIPALIPLEMSMPATSLTGQSFSLEMSMPPTSFPTSLTDQSFSLEMSMPTTGLTDQSFSHPPVQGGAIGSISTTFLETPMPVRSRRLTDQSVPYLPVEGATNAMVAISEIAENSAMTTGHSSVAVVAAIVSAIAGVVAFV